MISGADRLDGWLGGGLVARDAKNAARAAFDAARSADQRREDIEDALEAAAARGIATVHECGGPLLTSAGDFADVLELGRRPDLPRTIGYWAEAVTDPEQARALLTLHGAAGLGGDLNIDGSIGSHTAHLRESYADDPGCHGTAYRSSADVRDHVAACAVAGIQSGFHVIGDAGMDTVLEGYEAAADLVGLDVVRATRPRLEHAEMVDSRRRGTDGPTGHGRERAAGLRRLLGWRRGHVRGAPGTRPGTGHQPVRRDGGRGRAAGPRLGLAGDRLRPVGGGAGRGRAPRGGPAPRRRHRPGRAHQRGPRSGPRGRGRGAPGRRPGDLRGVGRADPHRRRPARRRLRRALPTCRLTVRDGVVLATG